MINVRPRFLGEQWFKKDIDIYSTYVTKREVKKIQTKLENDRGDEVVYS